MTVDRTIKSTLSLLDSYCH